MCDSDESRLIAVRQAPARYLRMMSSTSQPLLKSITVDPQATHTATVILVHVNALDRYARLAVISD